MLWLVNYLFTIFANGKMITKPSLAHAQSHTCHFLIFYSRRLFFSFFFNLRVDNIFVLILRESLPLNIMKNVFNPLWRTTYSAKRLFWKKKFAKSDLHMQRVSRWQHPCHFPAICEQKVVFFWLWHRTNGKLLSAYYWVILALGKIAEHSRS